MKYQDYFTAQRFNVSQLYFDCEGKRIHGRGILDWVPNEGFKLEACLNIDDLRGWPKSTLEFGKFGIKKTYSIYMGISGYRWAIAPDIILDDGFLHILLSGWISLTFDRIIFANSRLSPHRSKNLTSHAIYDINRPLLLSDNLPEKIKNSGHFYSGSWSKFGIYYHNENTQIIGRIFNENFIYLFHEANQSYLTKKQLGKWLDSAEYSLSLLSGQTVKLLYKQVHRGSKLYTEVRTQQPIYFLGQLSPLYQLHYEYYLKRDYFIKLTEFFTLNPKKAFICYNIFDQISEAIQQKNWQTTELLIATILEATLRTLDNQPFQKKKSKDKFKINESLSSFKDTYLSNHWDAQVIKKVLITHNDLRNRNAHPDWLFTQGGYLSKEEREKSLDDMIFLTRFYGYIILAIGEFKDLKPDFPSSHKEWSGLFSIRKYEELSPETKARFESLKQHRKKHNLP